MRIAISGFGLIIALVLAGCDVPGEERVAQDFRQLFAREAGLGLRPVIRSTGPGEGDSGNVYQHIKFDVVAEADVAPAEGWFAGIEFRKGQQLRGGEVVILYQRNEQGEWLVTSHTLTRAPRQMP